MKKSFLQFFSLLLSIFAIGGVSAQTYSFPDVANHGLRVVSETRSAITLDYGVQEFSLNSLTYKGETMSEISMQIMTIPGDEGHPNLPRESRFIAIPQGSKAVVNVISYEKEIIKDVNIAPALRLQAEEEEPTFDYIKDDKVYKENAFYPANPFELSEAISLRGVDAVILGISPFQYNPVTKELVVYTNVQVQVSFEGGNGHFGEDRLRSPYWDPILQSQLINYNQLPVIDYNARMQRWNSNRDYGFEYLIITPNNDDWAAQANLLKDLRTRQGILTEVMRLDEMGVNSTDALKAFFHNAYNTWDIPPVAVCLMADHGTNLALNIPAESVYHSYSGSCITDNRYADPTGDNLPDMTFCRLTAQNATELPIFVSKQIEYELQPNMDANSYNKPVTALGWQTERWFQICSEVTGGYFRKQGKEPIRINAIYQGTPANIWSSAQNTNNVVSYFGPNGMQYIPNTPSELGGWDGGTAEQIIAAVNEGTFLIQHRDHGLENGWGEPSFRNTHVSQMNNVGKLPFVMSINCLTGKFNHSSDCLMEAFMRRTYNGQNAGAVGVLCPTEVSFSFVNDAFTWGVYDLFDPNFMPDYGPYASYSGYWLPAFGNVAGKYFLEQSAWPYNTDNKDITYTMFTAHCDAFLQLYSEVPQTMTVVKPDVVLAGMTEVTITAPAGCTIALTRENNDGSRTILATAIATGAPQIVAIPSQTPPTIIDLVCKGQNYLRYESQIQVVPANGPYVVFHESTIHDNNNNGQVDFGETISLDVTLRNVGSTAIGDFNATITSDSEYVTITNGTASFEGMAADGLSTVNDAFSFTIANNVPDKTNAIFTFTINNGNDTYTSNMALTMYAPIIKVNGNMTINEINGNGNGRLDAGEEAELTFTFANEGHSNSNNAIATLQLTSPYIQVAQPTITFNTLEADETYTATYNVTVADNTPIGYVCEPTFNVTTGNYSDEQQYIIKVGLVVEDFETGELGAGWTNTSSQPWTIVSDEAFEGTKSLKSGAITHNGLTEVSFTHESGADDVISFAYKVSSENNYDKLHFYIDGVEKGTWSGTVNWTETSYNVTAGTHVYKWSYTKDGSMSNGSDCAWIDYIVLPSQKTMDGTAGPDVYACEGNNAQMVGYAINYTSILWTTAGDGSFSNATIADPEYILGTQDIANGQVTLTMTITGDGETITDEAIVFITENVSISNATPDNTYCAQSTPQEVGIDIQGEYSSLMWTTTGDGSFLNTSDEITMYTPGANDIANGNVMLKAIVQTLGCGPVTFDYEFNMSPAPQINIANTEINACTDSEIVLEIEVVGACDNNNFVVNISGTEYEIEQGQNTMTLPAIANAGTYTYNVMSIANSCCTTNYGEGENTITINVSEKPELAISNNEFNICLGEQVTIEATLSGTAPFEIEIDGMENYITENSVMSISLEPTESLSFTLVSITDANGCSTAINQLINVNVYETTETSTPEGDDEVDTAITETSIYTAVGNGENYSWSLTPETAGAIENNDEEGSSITITWNENHVGNTTLTVVAYNACGTSQPANKTIVVKNSTDVAEYNNPSFNIYPNPAKEIVNLDIENLNGKVIVEVYNVLGEKVISLTEDAVNGLKSQINVSNLSNGQYIIKATTGERVLTKNMMIRK